MSGGIVLVMGVCGTGKTTVAKALAQASGAAFIEADDLHPQSNVERMASGIPLTDTERWPWLERICDAASEKRDAGRDVVIACSALKMRYRDLMRSRLGDIAIVHLTGDLETIRRRMASRKGHFMPPTLLQSQLADLEAPGEGEHAFPVDIDQPVDAIVSAAAAWTWGQGHSSQSRRAHAP